MITLDIDTKFKFKKFNILKVGVIDAKIIKESDYSKAPIVKNGVTVSVMGRKNYKDKNGQESDEAGYWQSIVKNEPLYLKNFKNLVEKKGNILLKCWIGTEAEAKQGKNSLLALFRQAYDYMTRQKRNGKKRELQKGFNAYGRGTGQTERAVRVIVLPEKETITK